MNSVLARKAMRLAYNVHTGQKYGSFPYSEHLSSVAQKVNWLLAAHEKQNTIFACKAEVVAYLHDILEDTEVTQSELEKEFPKSVVKAVVLVTKEEGYNYSQYIIRIKADPLATTVKLADTIANLSFSMSNYEGKTDRRIKKYQRQYDLLMPAFLKFMGETL